MASATVPTIDFQDFPSQADRLLQAAEEWGCFRLINHSVPSSLMAEAKAAVRALLDLPVEIKLRNADVIAASGYVPPSEGNPLYEALGIYDVGSPQSVDEFCSLLEASPSQKETIVKYFEAIHELAMDIGQKLCQSMGLDKDLFKEWTCVCRMIKYNFTPETIGSSGVRIHTDSGLFIILQDDENIGGLEVMDQKSGAFIPINPLPKSFLINFGDIGKVWSNGRFCNVKHRVQCRDATTRVSIAFFILGPKDGVVETPPQLVDVEHPRLFTPLVIEDYRKLRLSIRNRAGEALDMLHAECSSE